MRSSGQIRFLGVVQLVLGLFLIGFMGVITLNVAPLLLNPAPTAGGARFTGTSQQAQLILALFGTVILFGFGSGLSGLWQIMTGRRNKWVVFVVLGIGVALMVVAAALNQLLGR